MTEQQWLDFALAQMHSGQWFGWKTHDDNGNKIPNDQRMTYENIIVHDNSITKPTKAEVNAKIQELKNFETDFNNKKTSGKQKLKDLGLNDDEIKSLMGV